MDLLLVALIVAVAVIGVTALAPKVGVAAPLLLVLLGVAISLVPAVPAVEIEPEWILGGVLPPLLYATSVSMPTMDFRRDLTAISGLSVALVVVTSVVLGLVFSWLIPDVTLATGIALGAVLSPTDAVATSIVRRSGVSPRVVTVLEGESLLNDASALVLLRSAVAATAASVTLWGVVGDFVFAVAVAVVVGASVGKASLWLRTRVSDPHLTTAISFLVPFIAYLPAERLGASGLVSTVAAGLVAGSGSVRLRPQDRIAEAANWRTLELLLEGAVFLVMGLEVYGLVEEVRGEHGSLWLALGLAALAAVVVLVVRTGYVTFLVRTLSRRARRGAGVRGLLTAANDRVDAFSRMTPEERAQVWRQGPSGTTWRAGSDPLAERGAGVSEAAAASPPGAGAPDGTAAAAPSEAPTVPPAPSAPSAPAREDLRRALGRRRWTRKPRARADETPETRTSRVRARITRRIADIDYLQAEPLGAREGVVLVWAGMRGVVTLAAAQSLPRETPHRALLILVAFTVAAGTLLVQGGTLAWVVRRLGLSRDGTDDRADLDRLVVEMSRAAAELLGDPDLRRPDGTPYAPAVLELARRVAERQAEEVDVEVDADTDRASVAAQVRELRLATLDAQRAALLRVRDLGTASSGALTEALTVLDADQISLELRAHE
ncbi:cation:proton antiporter [Cellulomonas sp. ES6]|uniref:cation:proton antiporter domain-containing protein n=1 Tax=Cellulomonas sp. ES6 TaxID=3039384 RepID=UPI0024B74493|nr:cation:proton antiporter [Cellulomonas sp. ES6]WHP18595.1 cation:proton antiporter [Cellulomonas sp. ES6]